ncbi:hypothetical protein D3C87_2183940 [compost metagenome]
MTNGQTVGEHRQFDVRKLASQMKTGRAGVQRNGHAGAYPVQRAVGNIRFIGIMAF